MKPTAVDESTSDDKPARAEPAAVSDPPCPGQEARRGPGVVVTNPVDVTQKERLAPVDSSEDENGDAIERLGLRQGEPDVLDHEKTASSRPQSRHASSFAHTDVVPRSQRRGLLGRFTLIPEVERPYEYKNNTKWTITAVVALAAAGGPMGSGIFLRESSGPRKSRIRG